MLISNDIDVVLFEKEKDFGGQWKTQWDSQGLMIEHSPRVVNYNYIVFLNLIEIFTNNKNFIKKNFKKSDNNLKSYLLGKLRIMNCFRVLYFILCNMNKDWYTISIATFLKSQYQVIRGNITALSNLTVAGINETSFGSI